MSETFHLHCHNSKVTAPIRAGPRAEKILLNTSNPSCNRGLVVNEEFLEGNVEDRSEQYDWFSLNEL